MPAGVTLGSVVGYSTGKVAAVLSGCSGLEDTEWQEEEAMQRGEERRCGPGDLNEESSTVIDYSTGCHVLEDLQLYISSFF